MTIGHRHKPSGLWPPLVCDLLIFIRIKTRAQARAQAKALWSVTIGHRQQPSGILPLGQRQKQQPSGILPLGQRPKPKQKQRFPLLLSLGGKVAVLPLAHPMPLAHHMPQARAKGGQGGGDPGGGGGQGQRGTLAWAVRAQGQEEIYGIFPCSLWGAPLGINKNLNTFWFPASCIRFSEFNVLALATIKI